MQKHSGKKIYWESQEGDYHKMMEEYYSDIDKTGRGTTGAILMGVCRGRLSEGLDFKDRKARLVIVIGIPYP